MTNRGAIHHPGPLRKTRCVRIGTITSHCPAFRGPFSATAKMLVCCPECWAAPLPFPLWRDGDPPEGSCLYSTKGLGRPAGHCQRGQARTRQCGGKCTKEEKSHISMLKLVSRKAPSLPFLLLPTRRRRNEGLWTLIIVMILRQDADSED